MRPRKLNDLLTSENSVADTGVAPGVRDRRDVMQIIGHLHDGEEHGRMIRDENFTKGRATRPL